MHSIIIYQVACDGHPSESIRSIPIWSNFALITRLFQFDEYDDSKENATGNLDWDYDGGLVFLKFDF